MRHVRPFRSALCFAVTHARTARTRWRGPALGVAAALSLTLAGCASGPADSASDSPSNADSTRASSASDGSDGGNGGNGGNGAVDSSDSATAEIAARRAREMAEAMSRGNITGEPAAGRSPRSYSGEPAGGAPDVRWSDAPRDAAANADALRAAAGSSPQAGVPAKVDRDPAALLDPSAPGQSSQPSTEPDPEADSEPDAHDGGSPTDRDELIQLLLARVRQSDDPAMRKAATAAVLSLVGPGSELDPASVSGLTLRERERVLRFHEAVRVLHGAVVEEQRSLDEDRVLAALRDVFGPQPIEIEKLELCKSVRGFGVYEPFEQKAFLAGQSQKMIVYLELENFVSREIGPEKREVRLTQEVVLYNATDGLAVWRQRPVEVVDQSRNARRDFFVVQMIELPANLGVGKYVLKVKIRDLHGETMHEGSRPIQLVADRELTKQRRGE